MVYCSFGIKKRPRAALGDQSQASTEALQMLLIRPDELEAIKMLSDGFRLISSVFISICMLLRNRSLKYRFRNMSMSRSLRWTALVNKADDGRIGIASPLARCVCVCACARACACV